MEEQLSLRAGYRARPEVCTSLRTMASTLAAARFGVEHRSSRDLAQATAYAKSALRLDRHDANVLRCQHMHSRSKKEVELADSLWMKHFASIQRDEDGCMWICENGLGRHRIAIHHFQRALSKARGSP